MVLIVSSATPAGAGLITRMPCFGDWLDGFVGFVHRGNRLSCQCEYVNEWLGGNHLFLEGAEGYVKGPDKSTPLPSTRREVFEHFGQTDSAGGKRLNVVVRVLSFFQSAEPPGTRTQGPRVRSGNPQARRNLSRRARRERTGSYRLFGAPGRT